jgi:transcriptional regulator with GAF, ATPase, and Fis domain
MAYSQDDAVVEYLDDWWLHRKDAAEGHFQLMGTLPSPDACLEARVGAYERELIVEALRHTRGNQTKAARLLGTTKRIIQYKIRKHDIDYRGFRTDDPRKQL